MSSDQNARLNVEVRQTSSGTAIKDAAADVRKLGDATKDTAREAGAGGKAAGQMGEAFEKGAGAGRGALAVLKGDLTGLGPLVKGLAGLLSGPVGLAAAAVGTIAAVAATKFKAAYEEKKKAAEETKKAIDETKKSAEELGKQRLEALRSNLEAVSSMAGDLVRDFESSISLAEKLADAQDALEADKIKNDRSLSEEERARRLGALAQRAEQRRSSGAISRAEVAVEAATLPRDSAQSAETDAARRYSAVTRQLDALREARRQAEEAIAKIVAERNARFAEIGRTIPNETERQGARREASAAAQAAAAPFVSRLDVLNGEQGRTREAGLVAAQGEAMKELSAANEAAIKAADALAVAEERLARVREEEASLAPAREELSRRQTDRAAQAGAEADVTRRQEAERDAILELGASDTATRAERFVGNLGNRARGDARLRSPEIGAAASDMLAAARAAREGGASEGELEQLLEAMKAMSAALSDRNLRVAAFERELSTLKSQIATLRTR